RGRRLQLGDRIGAEQAVAAHGVAASGNRRSRRGRVKPQATGQTVQATKGLNQREIGGKALNQGKRHGEAVDFCDRQRSRHSPSAVTLQKRRFWWRQTADGTRSVPATFETQTADGTRRAPATLKIRS